MPETIALFDDHYLEAATDKPAFEAFFIANSPTVFSATSSFSYQQTLSEMEKEKLEKPGSNLDNSYRLFFYLNLKKAISSSNCRPGFQV